MISAVAERYQVHPQTLRLYEREGLPLLCVFSGTEVAPEVHNRRRWNVKLLYWYSCFFWLALAMLLRGK